jgi:hypothetical protein
VPEMQGVALTDMVAALKENQMFVASQIVEFIGQCLIEEDVPRFRKLTHSKDVVIQLDLLGNIMTWLVEEYANRPTEAPSGSPNGHSSTVPTSTDASTPSASPTLENFLPNDFATSSTP